MKYSPPSGYRLPTPPYGPIYGFFWLPAVIGLLRGCLPGADAGVAPIITSPVNGQFEAQGVSFTVTAEVPAGVVAFVTLGSNPPVAMSVVGTTASATLTPGVGDIGTAVPIVVTIPSGSDSIVVDVEADVAFWIDSSDARSYTASGTSLTSIKSLVTGTPLNTIVGVPQIITDPRDGTPSFNFPDNGAGDYVMGADAAYLAATTGTDKAFCSVAVFESGDVAINGALDSVANSAQAGNGQFYLSSTGSWYFERDGAPAGPARVATSEFLQAGCCVVVQHSDGVSGVVKTSIQGAAETAAPAFASAGALSPNRVGIGVRAVATPAFPFYGMIKERIFFGVDKTPTQIAAIVNGLLAKWRATRAPVLYFLGDSITTAQLATNGGMPALISQRLRALGAYADPQGPFAVGQPYPYRHSAVSGNTCAQMTTRVNSTTDGLGLGGGSQGRYRRTDLGLLFAGTNDLSVPNYTTLLNAMHTKLMQSKPTARIAVTPITNVFGSTAAVVAFNAALIAVWDAFDAAHPATPLIRWNAFLAVPNDGSGTYYVDATHPNDAGYLRMVDDPTYGLLQAVLPYLLSIQPS